jgi:hypothetical protein
MAPVRPGTARKSPEATSNIDSRCGRSFPGYVVSVSAGGEHRPRRLRQEPDPRGSLCSVVHPRRVTRLSSAEPGAGSIVHHAACPSVARRTRMLCGRRVFLILYQASRSRVESETSKDAIDIG